ncbi:hypothetical protein T08_4993, partial [Trichinella sp. T8]
LPSVITGILLRTYYINGVGTSENKRTKQENVLSGNVLRAFYC